jgi:hypothetical protein
MPDKTLCPVCGKVVGPWHKSGVHPKCGVGFTSAIDRQNAPFGAKLTQTQRDKILRAISGPPRERTLRL